MVVDFFVAGVVDFFFVVSVLAELVVVIDSFLLAHEDIKKPTATRAVIEQIRDCFIGVVNERPECPAARASASTN